MNPGYAQIYQCMLDFFDQALRREMSLITPEHTITPLVQLTIVKPNVDTLTASEVEVVPGGIQLEQGQHAVKAFAQLLNERLQSIQPNDAIDLHIRFKIDRPDSSVLPGHGYSRTWIVGRP